MKKETINNKMIMERGDAGMRRVITNWIYVADGAVKDSSSLFGMTLVIMLTMIAVMSMPMTASAWTSIADTNASPCATCHGNPPVDNATRDATTGRFPGTHNTHAGAWYTTTDNRYGYNCEICHTNPNYTWTSHQNSAIQVNLRWISYAGSIVQGGSVAGWGSYSRGTSFALANVTTVNQVCTNTYCHSNGIGGNINAAGQARPIENNISPMWGTNTPGGPGCTPCHGHETGNPGNGAPWYTSAFKTSNWTTAKANSHQSHASSGPVCNNCHYSTTNTGNTITSVGNHIKMNYTVTPNPTAWFTYNYSFLTTGGTCSSNACHGGTAPKWGTGTWDCVSCHNSSFAKKLGIGTIRQVVGTGGDFNMSAAPTGSRHLYGATTIVKWDCIVCHREGSLTTGKASATYHNDGIATTGGLIHLRNVDTINEAVGWAIDNKRWNTTDFKNLDDFCLSCHDADGSSQVAVNSTNNGLFTGTAAWNTTRAGWNTWGGTYPGRAAMSPFNSTDWASGWNNASTWSTTSGNRASMINIKGMFNPGTQVGYLYDGSPSQHAVLGQRYSTIWTSWVAAAWSSYTTKKTRTNLNSTREVSVLSCADCHVLDSGSGAHGGVRKYNLWHSTNQEICTVCHARATYGGGTNGQGLGSRYTHYYRRTPYTAYGLDSTPATWGTIAPCMVCHAGWDGITTISRQQSYGGIHGSWSSFIGWNTVRSTAWATMSPYRFFPGTYRRSLMANGDGQYNSTTAPSCYFVVAGGNPDAFTSCSSHAAGGSVANPTPLYGRPVKY